MGDSYQETRHPKLSRNTPAPRRYMGFLMSGVRLSYETARGAVSSPRASLSRLSAARVTVSGTNV
jgi:hypothetical protein